MSNWTREQLNDERVGWIRTATPREMLTISLELEEIIGRRWGQQRIAELEADRDCRTNGGFLSNDLDCDRGTLALCATHKVAALEGRIAKLEALNQRLHRQVVKALLALTPEQALAEEEKP